MRAYLMGVGPARNELSRFRKLLDQAGVRAIASSVPQADCPALVYFTDASAELLATLRVVRERGTDRILAVAGPGAALVPEAAWELMHAGASDVIAWDSYGEPVQAIVSRLDRWRQVDQLIASEAVRSRLVGAGQRWIGLLRQIVEVARFTRASVLITGESGTGKELVARLIHELDDRPDKGDIVVLDCTTIVPTLSGSEFFGHEKGAFTGAIAARDGAFAVADGGTLFLDEVGELSPQLQAELLRVIQEGMYKRVGSDTWRTTDFRLVCATNRDLIKEQEAGRFRLDLYYRIAAWQFRLPPLRHRPEDIEPLAASFLSRLSANGAAPDMESAVRTLLRTRDYPGNIRDLRQLVERISQRHVGPGPITVGDVPEDDRPAQACAANSGAGRVPWHVGEFENSVRKAIAVGVGLREIASVAAETAVSIALAESGGSQVRAARLLGVTPRALQLRRSAGRGVRAVPLDPASDQLDAEASPDVRSHSERA
jgi:transcriptional regulator with GAF, ATPase, and Fis domain